MSQFESRAEDRNSYIDSRESLNEEGYSEEEEEEEYEDDEEDHMRSTQYREQHEDSKHALDLRWCVGFNYRLINGVINLTRTEEEDKRSNGKPITEIFYAVGHTGVIYDYEDRKQRLLQGHCNEITACAYNHRKGILVTADKGPNSLLVVWKVDTGTPIKSIFDPHPNGIQNLDITEEGDLIVTLSREEPDDNGNYSSQTISVWDWEEDGQSCISTGVLKPDKGYSYIHYQKYIQFRYSNPKEFVTSGRGQIRFWTMYDDASCKSYSPSPPNSDGDRHYTQTVFHPEGSQAISGTEEGLLVIWDVSLIIEQMGEPDHKREIKTINLLNSGNRGELGITKKEKKIDRKKRGDGKVAKKRKKKEEKENVGITVLKASKALLIIGASNGNVRFYDYQFRIVGWFEEEAGLGGVTSISLSNVFFHYDKVLANVESQSHEFSYPDFIVADRKAQIVLMKTEQFQEVKEEKKKGKTLISSIVSSIVSISARPQSSIVSIACTDGRIFEWLYMLKDSILNEVKTTFSGEPTCLKYSPDGKYMVVTTKGKNVYIYVVATRAWQNPLHVSQRKEYVHGTEIAFAYDSKSFSVMDNYSCVSLFKLDAEIGKQEYGDWNFVGKIKTHLLEVSGLTFGEYVNEETSEKLSKFYSIGKDKLLFCYNVEESKKNEIDVESYYKIDIEAEPTACIWYPVNYLREEILLVAGSDFKLKLWDTRNGVCRQTFLGPTYGDPINRFIYLNVHEKDEDDVPKYVAYTTEKKIVGVIKLPLDGNPNKTMGMIAHPGKISCISASSDGKYLFTSGADSIGSINMWKINYRALEEDEMMAKANEGSPLDTYPNLLEGGKNGEIYSDLKNFFYYAQIDSKTENPTKAQKLDGKIPYTSTISLMRALGYYPTVLESTNMLNEVYYSKFLDSQQYIDSLELETFVKLFVNHRPVYGLTMDLVKEKMSILSAYESAQKNSSKENKKNEGKKEDEEEKRAELEKQQMGKIDRDYFIEMLLNYGEALDEKDLKGILKVLVGTEDYTVAFPQEVTSEYLISKILGFEVEEEYEDAADNEGDEVWEDEQVTDN